MFLDKKVFYYPPCHREGYGNPYSLNYKRAVAKYCHLLDKDNKVSKMQSLTLLRYSFLADIFILNWPETIIFNRFGFLQYILLMIALLICKVRRCKIVWMFHNIHPHKGENFFTRSVQSFLFRHADLIIGHSKEACEYARQRTEATVEYMCHPVEPLDIVNDDEKCENNYDVLIWGTIYPYKGITEFISDKRVRSSGLRIHIVGRAVDQYLTEKVRSSCNEGISFDDRRVGFQELFRIIKSSKYVLFPYIGDSISSSGALIDTVVLGGTPVGPDRGAFRDLAAEGVCMTYSNIDDCLAILHSGKIIDETSREKFIRDNLWDKFAEKVIRSLLIG